MTIKTKPSNHRLCFQSSPQKRALKVGYKSDQIFHRHPVEIVFNKTMKFYFKKISANSKPREFLYITIHMLIIFKVKKIINSFVDFLKPVSLFSSLTARF